MNRAENDDGDCNWNKIKNDMKDHERALDDLVFTGGSVPEELLSRNVFGKRESCRITEEVSLSEILRACKEAAAVSREVKSVPHSNRNSASSEDNGYEGLVDGHRSQAETRESISSTSSLVKTATLKATLDNLECNSFAQSSENVRKSSKERKSGALLKWQKHVQTVSAFLALKNNEKPLLRCSSDKYKHETKKSQKSECNGYLRSASVESPQGCFPKTQKYAKGKIKVKKNFAPEEAGFIVSSSNILSQPAEFFRSAYQG